MDPKLDMQDAERENPMQVSKTAVSRAEPKSRTHVTQFPSAVPQAWEIGHALPMMANCLAKPGAPGTIILWTLSGRPLMGLRQAAKSCTLLGSQVLEPA